MWLSLMLAQWWIRDYLGIEMSDLAPVSSLEAGLISSIHVNPILI